MQSAATRSLAPSSPGGDQLDLDRPLHELTLLLGGSRRDRPSRTGEGPGGAAGTATGQGCRLGGLGGRLPSQNGGLVVGDGFPLYKGDSIDGTGGQAVPQTVAVVVPQQAGLAVYHADGPLVAGLGAGSAAVAGLLVDVNDLADHSDFLPQQWAASPPFS